MDRGQLHSLEALTSLLVVLVASAASLAVYSAFPRENLMVEEYRRAISSALFKLDELGVLTSIASRGDWQVLLGTLKCILPSCEVELTVYDKDFTVVYHGGDCGNHLCEVYYALFLPSSGNFYALRVRVGESHD
ncbi:MAG: hypothetical protein NDF55_05580 [archaeon GB-1867-005]|nr:hypothetical protein [Candidatus Culexmicrobium cathedralense]